LVNRNRHKWHLMVKIFYVFFIGRYICECSHHTFRPSCLPLNRFSINVHINIFETISTKIIQKWFDWNWFNALYTKSWSFYSLLGKVWLERKQVSQTTYSFTADSSTHMINVLKLLSSCKLILK
jgi:hypothetical protein